MGRLLFFCVIFFIAVLMISSVEANSVLPLGYDFDVVYEHSDSEIAITDTLIITYTLANNETFPITGLYFSDNLPAGINVVEQSVRIDGIEVEHFFVPAMSDGIVEGFDRYTWVVDDVESQQVQNTVQPGETAVLTLRLTADETGEYSFPHHDAVFSGNSTGFFSSDSSRTVSVVLSVGVDDTIDDEPGLPSGFFTSKAYPNPFNGEVHIAYTAAGMNGQIVTLELFNALGQRIEEQSRILDTEGGVFVWSPRGEIATGAYFYRLTVNDRTETGRVLYLK